MLDQAFIKKKMKKIIASYIQDPSTELSTEEIDILLAEFNKRIINEEEEENVHFLIHDIIYEHLTKNYF
jgi:tRNA U38,U39,U40 pseudouridine synthase TruA